jgi:hypothetical protein
MTVTSDTRKPYSGNTRSLVLAFDVGTTFSGVSYAILEPNEIPQIHGVTRYVPSHPYLFFFFFLPRTYLPHFSASQDRNMWSAATRYQHSCITMRTVT